jgi:probable HAF family extracellular repeat protein
MRPPYLISSVVLLRLLLTAPTVALTASNTFQVIDVPGAFVTSARGINDAGQIVGSFDDGTGIHGFLLSDGGFTTIDVPGAFVTSARGINNSGQIVGSFDDADGTHGFLLSGGGFTTIDVPGAFDTTVAMGINDSGQIVGSFDDETRFHGFLLSGGGFTTIDVPGTFNAVAMGINNSGQIVGSFDDDADGTHGFLLSDGEFTTIDVPCAFSTNARGINNFGQIVGVFRYATGRSHGFVLSSVLSSALSSSVTLLDPVPELLDGPEVTIDSERLAIKGRQVCGVAADGVTQLVLRISAQFAGEQFSLTLLNDKGGAASLDEDGALGRVGITSFGSSANVVAVDTSDGPRGFAVYRAPRDFPRLSGEDSSKAERTVFIKVQSSNGTEATVSVRVVRPPVVLIHGVWSDSNTWESFQPLISDTRFFIRRVNYQSTNGDGFRVNAGIALPQIRVYINEFKALRAVAAVQADIVAHSMGGVIARYMVLLGGAYFRDSNYRQGEVHKLITIDSPHNGTDLATQLLSPSEALCREVFELAGKKVGDAMRDMVPGSAALQDLQQPTFPLLAHAIAGIANSFQTLAAELNYQQSLLSLACPFLLPFGGFNILFVGPNDLLVSEASEEARGLGFDSKAVPFSRFVNFIHTVDPVLFPEGPDVMSRVLVGGQLQGVLTEIPPMIINLLNQSVLGPAFGPIRP